MNPHPRPLTDGRKIAGLQRQANQLERAIAPAVPSRTRELADVGGPSALSNRQHYAYDYDTGVLVPVPPDPFMFGLVTPTVGIIALGAQAHDDGGNIIGVALLLTTTGTSGTTTARLRKNGSVVSSSSVSVAAGAANASGLILLPARVAFGGPFTDYFQCEVTAVATGAAGMTFFAARG